MVIVAMNTISLFRYILSEKHKICKFFFFLVQLKLVVGDIKIMVHLHLLNPK